MMTRTYLALATTAASLALLASAPALAASSDYLLTLDDVKDGVSHPTTIEVLSWSFGASNPTSIGSSGMSAGRQALTVPPASNGQVSVQTAREAGSGMATGRRCAMGKHYASATLLQRAQRWTLTNVMVSSCASDGMTLSYATATTGAPPADATTIIKSKSNITNN